MRKWLPMLILASAQFIMVLDSSVMNVAISQIVEDLDTTIQGVQTAITLYTLVMAAFMLLGAKLGDILGRNQVFAIGLAIYGLGSLTTALSPNLAVLLVGWSGVEGFGAVLVVPAIAALTAANYEGRDRALAYALLGGIAAVAIAAGPLIGGWVTTEFTWRYVFASETVVVIGILLAAPTDRAGAPSRATSTARRRGRAPFLEPGWGSSCSRSCAAVCGALSSRARRRRSTAPRSRPWVSPWCRSWCSPDSRCSGRSSPGNGDVPVRAETCCSTRRCCASRSCGRGYRRWSGSSSS